MRCIFGFLCVCALGMVPVVGCSETTGDGGNGGSAGTGGIGGDGGTGGMPECESAEDCDDENECTGNACADGVCQYAPVADGTACDESNECTVGTCADGTCDSTPVADGTACSDGACLNGACTALGTVSGIVDGGESPGVTTVSVDGTSLSTTTDGLGQFSFGVFPGDWFFQTTKDNKAWGGIQLETVPTTGRSDLKLEVGLDEEIPVVEEECMIEVDEAKGLVSLSFNPVSGEGGETATLSVPHDGAVTDDAEGNCVVTETLPAGQRDLSFFNVDLTEELIVTPMGPDGYRCSLERPGTVYPVRASFHTRQVGVRCTPL